MNVPLRSNQLSERLHDPRHTKCKRETVQHRNITSCGPKTTWQANKHFGRKSRKDGEK